MRKTPKIIHTSRVIGNIWRIKTGYLHISYGKRSVCSYGTILATTKRKTNKFLLNCFEQKSGARIIIFECLVLFGLSMECYLCALNSRALQTWIPLVAGILLLVAIFHWFISIYLPLHLIKPVCRLVDNSTAKKSS